MSNPQPQHTIRQYEVELRGLRTDLLKTAGLSSVRSRTRSIRW